MHLMNWIVPTASFLEILLLLYVAMIDIATRLIRNEICLVLALLGIASQFAGPMQVTESLIAATILLLLLIVIYQRGWIGGGDVKLLVALAIGLPLMGVIQLLTITALAGGVLALVHLMMRHLPYPRLAPAGSPPSSSRILARSAAGSSAVIQSRESTLSEAIAAEMRWRRCPQNDRAPNQTTPLGLSRPRTKRRTTCSDTGAGRTTEKLEPGGGAPKRNALINLLRGNVIREVSNSLPEEIDLLVYA